MQWRRRFTQWKYFLAVLLTSGSVLVIFSSRMTPPKVDHRAFLVDGFGSGHTQGLGSGLQEQRDQPRREPRTSGTGLHVTTKGRAVPSQSGCLANPHNFKVLIWPRVRCHPDLYVIAYVHSDPRDDIRRQLIRQTWGNPQLLRSLKATLLFLLGKVDSRGVMEAVARESSVHGDILMEDFADSYRNLTHKATMGLKWVSVNCQTARYLLKADSDVLVDVVGLVRHLKTSLEPQHGQRGIILCRTILHGTVFRDPRHKWFLSREEFPRETFDPFCKGLAYVMSTDVVRKLFEVSKCTPFLWVDDFYVTGALVRKTNYTFIDFSQAFVLDEWATMDRVRDGSWKELRVFHLKNPLMFIKIWSTVRHRNKLEKRLDVGR